jgi:hypothetical protein
MNSSPNPSLRPCLFGHFDAPPIPAAEVWIAICAYMEEIGVIKKGYHLSPGMGKRRAYRQQHFDHKVPGPVITDELAKDDYNNFVISHDVTGEVMRSQDFTFHQIPRQREGFQQLFVLTGAVEGLQQNWSRLVERLVAWGNLVWLGNTCTPYITWQNCSIPENYEKKYGGIANFETYDLHGSLTLNVLRNPGSNHVHGGVLVRANSEMWLGPSFWDFAPCTKEEVLAADFFIEKRETPHYLYLKSWPHPFTRPDGEQGRVQQKLWRLLYQQDCEWPPGSGTICDEPMYGPPELMPKSADGEVAPAT